MRMGSLGARGKHPLIGLAARDEAPSGERPDCIPMIRGVTSHDFATLRPSGDEMVLNRQFERRLDCIGTAAEGDRPRHARRAKVEQPGSIMLDDFRTEMPRR